MRRWLTTATGLVAVAALAATLGAAAAKPYIGTWKARLTADELLDAGIVQPKMKGVWKLALTSDGKYRMYNPWDKWTSGEYSADATRLVVRKDTGCLAGGLKGPGLYRWSVKAGKLKLTSVYPGSDPCGGRWQTLAIPLWTRA